MLKEQGPEAVWPEPARTNEHKRGEVRPILPNHHQHSAFTLSTTRASAARRAPPERATARRWGVYTTEKSAKSNLSAEGFEAWKAQHGTPAGADAETDPTFGPMPSTIEEVSNNHMAALLWLLVARVRSLSRPFLLLRGSRG